MGKSWLIAGIFVIILLLVGIGAIATAEKSREKASPLYKVRIKLSTGKTYEIKPIFLKGRLTILSWFWYKLERMRYGQRYIYEIPTCFKNPTCYGYPYPTCIGFDTCYPMCPKGISPPKR